MIRQMKRELSFLALIAFGLTASAAVTYKWTGAAGNLNWSDAANWSAEGGSVDMSATVTWDFTGLPTGSTVTQQSGTIKVAGITFTGSGSWTLAAASGAIVQFPDTGALSVITVPSGSTLDITFPLASANTLGSQDIRFTGKGTIRVNPSTGSFVSSRKLRVTTDWTTLVIGPNWATTSSCSFYLENTSSRLRAERDCELGALSNWGHGIVDANGHTVKFTSWGLGNYQNFQLDGSAGEFLFGSFANWNMTYNAPAMTGGRIVSYNGYVNAGSTVWPAGVGIGIEDSGSISFGASQSVAALSGEGVSGAIKLGDGASLTTTFGGDATVFSGRIAGGADFTKAGSYDLTLEGSGTYSGKTTVQGGTLRLPAKKAVKGLRMQLLFDDATAPGKESSGWNFIQQGDANGLSEASSSITGKAISFDLEKQSYLKSSSAGRPSGLPVGNDPFTVQMWVKPASGVFSKRASNTVDIFNYGSIWDNADMGWFYLAWSRQIVFATANMSISYDPGNVYPFADGKWHHVATTYDGNCGQKLYLDGVCVAEKTMPHGYAFSSSAEVLLGRRDPNTNYAGDMDDVQFYSRCCSADEIAAEFANRRPSAGSLVSIVEARLPAPVAHYDFEDASNPGKDVSGNGYDLTAFGSWAVADCYSPSDSGKKAFVLAASGENGLKWTGEGYPAKMPTSNHDFTLAMRYVNNGSGEGTAVAAFGDMSTHYGFFEAGINGWPRRHVCNCWYVGNQGHSLALTDTPNLDGSTAAEAGWTEIVYVYTASDQTIKAYRDGHFVTSTKLADSAIWLGSKDLSIGWRSDRSAMCFKGSIDDVRIYSAALNAEQVKLVARDQAGLSLAPAIPETSPVTVAAGATLVSEGDATLHDLDLAGTVTAPVRSLLTLTGTANVSGQVTGGCSVSVPTGSTVALAAGRVPFADVGQLTLPEMLSFTVDALPSDDGTWKTYVIATATGFVLPANFDGWTVAGLDTAKYRYGFAAENGTLTLTAKANQGLLLILR